MKTRKHYSNYAHVKDGSAKDGKLTAIASTGTIDRDGEIILPGAFKLEDYRRNPVILAAHQHRSSDGMPTIIGSASRIEVRNDALEFDMTFATTDLAKQWQSLFEQGHAKAFSVGFRPINGEYRTVEGKDVFVYTEAELFEISAVAVPANPDALVEERLIKSMEKLVDQRIEQKLSTLVISQLRSLNER